MGGEPRLVDAEKCSLTHDGVPIVRWSFGGNANSGFVPIIATVCAMASGPMGVSGCVTFGSAIASSNILLSSALTFASSASIVARSSAVCLRFSSTDSVLSLLILFRAGGHIANRASEQAQTRESQTRNQLGPLITRRSCLTRHNQMNCLYDWYATLRDASTYGGRRLKDSPDCASRNSWESNVQALYISATFATSAWEALHIATTSTGNQGGDSASVRAGNHVEDAETEGGGGGSTAHRFTALSTNASTLSRMNFKSILGRKSRPRNTTRVAAAGSQHTGTRRQVSSMLEALSSSSDLMATCCANAGTHQPDTL